MDDTPTSSRTPPFSPGELVSVEARLVASEGGVKARVRLASATATSSLSPTTTSVASSRSVFPCLLPLRICADTASLRLMPGSHKHNCLSIRLVHGGARLGPRDGQGSFCRLGLPQYWAGELPTQPLTLLVDRRMREWVDHTERIPRLQNGSCAGCRIENNVFALRTAIDQASAHERTL
ncbi:hypothetical protein BV20DRAFT_297954 [Pilatotrama ljubarskyi]|nr:hypothetical protein BV20DRAFT_297954 [Pilatotrama ljubarskyi]